jgi:hypothetical protein
MLRYRRSCPLLAVLAVPLFVACGYGDHMSEHHDGDGTTLPPVDKPTGKVEEATIDVDQLLEVDPGAGAGAFVEYESGGTYHVTTSCDVEAGGECYWDIVVTPLGDAGLFGVAPFDLEADDTVTLGTGNQVRLVASTGKDFDGFDFQTDPGAGIEVDVFLDDAPGNRYLFWVGDGALRSGAPTNPVDLVPSAE